MNKIDPLFPAEISYHKERMLSETLQWLESEYLAQNEIKTTKSLSELADFYLTLVELNPIIDAEIVHIATKLGVMTGKLSRVMGLEWSNKAASILGYQGMALVFLNRFVDAEDYFVQAEKKALLEKDDAIILEIYGMRIYFENARYNYYKGLEYLKKAVSLYETTKNVINRKQLLPWMQWSKVAGSKSLLKLGNVQQSLFLNQSALNIANDANDKFFRAFSLVGIGHALDMVGKPRESIKIYLKAMKLSKHIHGYNLTSIICNRLGMATAWRLNRVVEGAEYFRQAVKYSDLGEGSWLREGPQWNLAAAYEAIGDYNRAISAIQDITFYARQAGESRTELVATLNLAKLLEEKGDYDEARKVREAGTSLANLLGIKLSREETSENRENDYIITDENEDQIDYDDKEENEEEENFEDDEEVDKDVSIPFSDEKDKELYSSWLNNEEIQLRIDLGTDDEDEDENENENELDDEDKDNKNNNKTDENNKENLDE